MNKHFFIAGIGTNIGKTFVSSILVEALQADYWKPVQCGDLIFTDSNKVRSLISNSHSKIWPEYHQYRHPLSPYEASVREDHPLQLQKMIDHYQQINASTLIIEGAGGILVPLNEQATFVDFIKQINIPVILVIQNYLGCLNHSLLTIEMLKYHQITLQGLIFNGPKNQFHEDYILQKTQTKFLGHFDDQQVVDQQTIHDLSQQWKKEFVYE